MSERSYHALNMYVKETLTESAGIMLCLGQNRTELYLHSGRNLRHMRIFTMSISHYYC